MPKRLVTCRDGTWIAPDELGGGVAAPTNVAQLTLRVVTRDEGVEKRWFGHQSPERSRTRL
jgi:hypothetical protein